MTPTTADLGLRRLGQLTAATDGSSALATPGWPPASEPRPTRGPALILVPLDEDNRCEADGAAQRSRPPAGPSDRLGVGQDAAASEAAPSALRAQARGLVQALVEILAGDRTLTQLVRWTTAEVYEQLHHRVLTLSSCPPVRPVARHTTTQLPRRARVATVHLSEPADGVVEAAARVVHAQRSTAVALRLERRVGARRVPNGSVTQRVAEERWVCSAVTWV